MEDSGLFCIGAIVFLVLVLVVSIYITSRPKKLCEIPNLDLALFIPQVVQVMHRYGWKTKVYPKNGKIHVIKNEKVATNVFLKPRIDGNIDVLFNVSTTYFGWFITLIGAGQWHALRLHRDSEYFATREVIPLIRSCAGGSG